jgi:transcriptional regulator with XRE-family HTH domain
MATVDRERLRSLIAERQTTPRALSRAVGDNDSLVRDILSGKSNNPRADTVAKLASELGVTVPALLTDGPTDSTAQARKLPEEITLPIRFEVAAGPFLEVEAYDQEGFGTAPAHRVKPFEGLSNG